MTCCCMRKRIGLRDEDDVALLDRSKYGDLESGASARPSKRPPIFLLCILIGAVISIIVILTVRYAPNQKHPHHGVLVYNANIWTADSANPSAKAIFIDNGTIVAIGTGETVFNYLEKHHIHPDVEIDGGGTMFVTPGLTDSHVHLLSGGFSITAVHLEECKSPQSFIDTIAEYALKVGEGKWITLGNWDHTLWGGELPQRSWIDNVTTLNPVYVSRSDGHMALCNSLALNLANITDDTQDPPGGTFVRLEDGTLSGIVKDNAMGMIESVIPPKTQEEEDEAMNAAVDYLLSNGVTCVHHMSDQPYDTAGVSIRTVEAFERARKRGVPLRIYASYSLGLYDYVAQKIATEGKGDQWLHIGNLKGFSDGSLGSQTAYQWQPYVNTTHVGLIVTPEDDLYNWTLAADRLGLQVSIHACGDRGATMVLDVMERVAKDSPIRDRRFRLEHAQQMRQADISRLAAMNITASMQPYHAIDDGRWAEQVLGPERINDLYAFSTFLNLSALLAFGSDWYVAPASPLMGLYAAATRRTLDGANPDGWIPQQKISVLDALYAYTIGASYSGYEETYKGMLRVGYVGDLVLFDQNLLTIDPINLPNVRILKTIVGGRIGYPRT